MLNLPAATQAAIAANEVWVVNLVSLEIGTTTYYITDHYKEIPYGGQTYLPNGNLLSIANVDESVEIGNQTINIALSGIDTTFRRDVIQFDAIGGTVEIDIAFLNTSTGAVIDDPLNIYTGTIWSVNSVEENSSNALRGVAESSTFTITAEVRSLNYIMENRPGRFTEDASNNAALNKEPDDADADKSMEFIPSLDGRNLHFGGS